MAKIKLQVGKLFKRMYKSPKTNLPIRNQYLPWVVSALLLFSDIIAIGLSFFISFNIRVALIPLLGGIVNVDRTVSLFLLATLSIVGLFILNNHYPGVGRIGVIELMDVFRIVTISFVILGLAIFILSVENNFSRAVFLISWFFACLIISVLRLMIHNIGSKYSWWGQPYVVIGYRKDILHFIPKLLHARRLAIKPVLTLLLDEKSSENSTEAIPVFPYSTNILREIHNVGIRHAIFISSSERDRKEENSVLSNLRKEIPKIVYVLGESPISSLSIKPIDIEGRPSLSIQYNLLNPFARTIKRIVEILISIFASLFAIPLFIIIGVLIKIDSYGPIFYKQKRLGKNGHTFDLYKFRTMVVNSDEILATILERDHEISKEYQKFHKIQNDPRITRIGKFLRKSSLDELPQLLNVCRGEMSLVGPRAYLPQEKPRMGASADLILQVAPGITGWWQVMGRHTVPFTERILLDEYYISNFSLWMDFYILIKTIWVVISGDGN
ncbi:MAG: undecaprenyl-phosphate galactose phosphotransferase WbaP [Candidatus Methanofastidiosa archaeon]|nr:undecaprenyl-phosphate galactose phosphotransferase WbaP [Candidatus Methanofastidiosa archaeon]